MKYTLFTDGASRSNPGDAGAGAIAFDEEKNIVFELACFLGEYTNNYAEYMAVLLGLKRFVGEVGDVKNVELEVFSDSKLVVEQLKGTWKIKEPTLRVCNQEIKEFLSSVGLSPTFTHIPREENGDADRLANKGIDDGIPCDH